MAKLLVFTCEQNSSRIGVKDDSVGSPLQGPLVDQAPILTLPQGQLLTVIAQGQQAAVG